MAVETFANSPTTIVTSGGTDAPASGTTETWTVQSSASFPAAATNLTQFHVVDTVLPSEVILVTNVSGTTWSVTRGAEGSTPIAHSAEFTIFQIATAGALESLYAVDWLNVVTMFGADPTGASDSTAAINNAISAATSGQTVYFPAGKYLINGSPALAVTTSGVSLAGDGYFASIIKIGSSFSGSYAVQVNAPNVTVKDLQVTAASATITSNPACNGLEVMPGAYQVTLQNLFFSNVNGWAIEAYNANGFDDISHAVWDSIMIYDTAGGIHFNGNVATVGTVISNLQIGNIGAASGTNANLDAFFVQDAFDIIMTNCGLGVGDAGTGHCMHFKGKNANIWVMNTDCGGYPEPVAKTQCGIYVEDDTNGSSNGLRFIGSVLQTFGIGAQVTGASSNIWFTNVAFDNNLTHGSSLTGTGTNINFLGCSWGEAESNGQVADSLGPYYDFSLTSSATGYVRSSRMCSAVVAEGTAGVQGVTALSGGTAMMFEHVDFLGTSSSIGNIFTNQPNFVRDCRNYNPHGSTTVTVPSSGSASGSLHYDAMFYITTASVSYSFTATNASPCVFTASGSSYANGNPVQLTGGSLPTGFTAGTTYYVVSASGTTFELSATSGGTAINSTSTGSGTVTGVLNVLRNTNGNGGGVGPTTTIPAGQFATIFARAGTNLTLTYANAPTWVVDGM